MDTVLIIIGVIGFGIVLVAVYVFTVAARNYVSEQPPDQPAAPADDASAPRVDRAERMRREQTEVQSFPITIDGEVIDSDRRDLPDRRHA